MKNTPIQNVIEKMEKLVRETEVGSEERRKLNLAISYLWDELDNERQTMVDIFDQSKKEHTTQVTGKMWVNKHFMDYQKFL
jgi:uncharacterized membrane protein